MRPRALPSIFTLVFVLAVPSLASADASHLVGPGESLSSVAAADGLSVSRLAAANGLSTEAELIAGTVITIPAVDAESGLVAGSEAQAPSEEAAASEVGDAYLVEPGDTLAAIAARSGMSVESLAALNELDPEGLLLAGTVLRVVGHAGAPEEATVPAADAAPYPTEETIAPSQVGAIAEENGVPGSFAEAIANQESGFNNAFRSGSDARGVMQILPETWSWIGRDLAGSELDPASASSNVRGGVLMLRWLLNETGGDPGLAAAGYYQGLESVRSRGELPETEQYVGSVLAQQASFAGE
jgi:LysM repeat protein